MSIMNVECEFHVIWSDYFMEMYGDEGDTILRCGDNLPGLCLGILCKLSKTLPSKMF